MLDKITVAEFIEDRANGMSSPWIVGWLPADPQSVIVKYPHRERTDDIKRLDAIISQEPESLGWTGLTESGYASWIGFDLDVGHGKKSYTDTATALADAHRIRDTLQGNAEIRLSRSGIGVHIRHSCADAMLTNSEAVAFAKRLVNRLDIKADPSPLGRQCFYFWSAHPGPDGYKLIASDDAQERRPHVAA